MLHTSVVSCVRLHIPYTVQRITCWGYCCYFPSLVLAGTLTGLESDVYAIIATLREEVGGQGEWAPSVL
jgi:hypothetical protein